MKNHGLVGGSQNSAACMTLAVLGRCRARTVPYLSIRSFGSAIRKVSKEKRLTLQKRSHPKTYRVMRRAPKHVRNTPHYGSSNPARMVC